jgi:hypothetical protein
MTSPADLHFLGRLERLAREREAEEAPDLSDRSDKEIKERLAAARHGALWGFRTGDFSGISAPDPLALLSDAEIVRRLRKASRKIAVRKLAAEGVPARSAVALLALGDPR